MPQKVEIANYLLSGCPLRNTDFQTRSTTAFLCGGGAALYRPEIDEVLGWQLEQIKSLLKSHLSLGHPLLLPAILLRTHSERVEIRANNLEKTLIALEVRAGLLEVDGGRRPLYQLQRRVRLLWRNKRQ